MRHYILILFLLGYSCYSYTQASVSGFYVTKTNDTISTQIKIPKSIFGSIDFSKFLFKVELSDSIRGTRAFKPKDIKCFWFFYNGDNYSFFSKPTITQNNLKFLQPIILEQNTCLYQFQTKDQNGVNLGTFYTFEKADGSFAFLNTGMRKLDNYKATLKDFYKESIELQQLVDAKFQTKMSIKNDIYEIVQTANTIE